MYSDLASMRLIIHFSLKGWVAPAIIKAAASNMESMSRLLPLSNAFGRFAPCFSLRYAQDVRSNQVLSYKHDVCNNNHSIKAKKYPRYVTKDMVP